MQRGLFCSKLCPDGRAMPTSGVQIFAVRTPVLKIPPVAEISDSGGYLGAT